MEKVIQAFSSSTSESSPFPLSLFSFVDCQHIPLLTSLSALFPVPNCSLVFCLAVTFSSSLVHARVLLDGSPFRPTQSFHASSPSSTSSRSLVRSVLVCRSQRRMLGSWNRRLGLGSVVSSLGRSLVTRGVCSVTEFFHLHVQQAASLCPGWATKC